MFGTGPFAVPTFRALLTSTHTISALVTRPIDDAGRRRKSAANPMRDLGLEYQLPILSPIDANATEFVGELQQHAADLFVVCDYGQILSNDCLDASRLGGINLHGSLLPRYRGAAPINWAIYHGDDVLGVSVIHMTRKLDGGPVLTTAQLSVPVTESAADVEPRLASLGVAPVLSAIERLEQWDGHSELGLPQDPKRVSSARRLRKEDGLVRWARTARQIVNQVRAFQPWPGTYTHWQRTPQAEPLRLIVNRTAVVDDPNNLPSCQPGEVAHVDRHSLIIQTGKGHLSLLEVQPAGKKNMPIEAFLRGYPVQIGDTFS